LAGFCTIGTAGVLKKKQLLIIFFILCGCSNPKNGKKLIEIELSQDIHEVTRYVDSTVVIYAKSVSILTKNKANKIVLMNQLYSKQRVSKEEYQVFEDQLTGIFKELREENRKLNNLGFKFHIK
jgi:hypothetical protein